jgi:predicted DNA-binding transcriptional regulator AlpA
MLNRLPRQLPPLADMLADIGNPTPREIAKALGYSERTVRSWLQSDTAPRAVMLAVFWLTRWGVSSIDAEAQNLIQMHAGRARCEQERADELADAVDVLERSGQFGAANSPIMLAAHRHRASNPDARTSHARTRASPEPVMPVAYVRPGHLKTGPA